MIRLFSLLIAFGYTFAVAGGKLYWQVSGTFTTSQVVNGGRIFVGSDKNLKCFDLATGSELWAVPLAETTQCTPAVQNGYVIAGCNGGVVYCFQVSNGHLVWSTSPNGVSNGYMGVSPAISEGKIFVPIDNILFCFDLTNGSEIWRQTAGAMFWGIGQNSCAVSNSRVYATNEDSHLYCLDSETGTILWSYLTGDEILAPPLLLPPYVYIGSDDHKFYCLNMETGSKVWEFLTGDRIIGGASASEDYIYVPSADGRIYKINALTGESANNFLAGNSIYSPVLSDNYLYVLTWPSKVYCLNTGDLTKAWSLDLTGSVFWKSLALSDGKLVFNDGDNLYCVQAETSGQGDWPSLRHDALNSGNTDGPVTLSNSAPYVYNIPHLAGTNWDSNIIVYNPTDAPITFYLNKWDSAGVSEIEEMEFSVGSKKTLVIDQSTLGYLGIAQVRSQSPDLSVKLTYQYIGSESLCEFFIPRDTEGEYWLIPNSIQDWFDWFGLALANHNNSSVSVRLDAYMSGTLVASTTKNVPAHTKIVAVSSDIWTGIDYPDVDMVIIISSQPIGPPLSITGNNEQDRHVFFLGQRIR